MGEDDHIIWGRGTQKAFTKEYYTYADALVDTQVNFAQRLKDEYGIAPNMMGK